MIEQPWEIITGRSIHTDLEVPYGMRNRGGYFLFFREISHYSGQSERYIEELNELIATASLLRAAPDLLASLESVMGYIDSLVGCPNPHQDEDGPVRCQICQICEMLEDARAAIAKAAL